MYNDNQAANIGGRCECPLQILRADGRHGLGACAFPPCVTSGDGSDAIGRHRLADVHVLTANAEQVHPVVQLGRFFGRERRELELSQILGGLLGLCCL